MGRVEIWGKIKLVKLKNSLFGGENVLYGVLCIAGIPVRQQASGGEGWAVKCAEVPVGQQIFRVEDLDRSL